MFLSFISWRKKNPESDSNDVVSLYSCDVDSNNYNDYANVIVIAIIIVIVLGVNGPLMLTYKQITGSQVLKSWLMF